MQWRQCQHMSNVDMCSAPRADHRFPLCLGSFVPGNPITDECWAVVLEGPAVLTPLNAWWLLPGLLPQAVMLSLMTHLDST